MACIRVLCFCSKFALESDYDNQTFGPATTLRSCTLRFMKRLTSKCLRSFCVVNTVVWRFSFITVQKRRRRTKLKKGRKLKWQCFVLYLFYIKLYYKVYQHAIDNFKLIAEINVLASETFKAKLCWERSKKNVTSQKAPFCLKTSPQL